MSTEYELVHYPTDGEAEDRTLVGTYPTASEAMAASRYPDRRDWQESGNSFIPVDELIESLGRECSPYLIQPARGGAVRAQITESSGTITLRLVEHGERTIEVDRGEYEAAKAAGDLDHFLDVYVSNIDSTTTVVEPDGTERNLWG